MHLNRYVYLLNNVWMTYHRDRLIFYVRVLVVVIPCVLMVRYCCRCLWQQSDDGVSSVSIGVWPIVSIFLQVLVVVVAEVDSAVEVDSAAAVLSKSQAVEPYQVVPSYPVVVASLAVGPSQLNNKIIINCCR